VVKEGGLDGTVTRIRVRHAEGAFLHGYGVPLLGRGQRFEVWSQLYQLDATPKRTEGQPTRGLAAPTPFNVYIRINGVPKIPARDGLNNHAMIGPLIVGIVLV